LARGKHYDWADGPAEIDAHSLTKHSVLVAYLLRYFEQRTLNTPGREQLRLTIVDGFCGGGLYTIRGTGEEVLGSPLRILNAVQEAQVLVNQGRTKPLLLDVQYVFIDKDRKAIAHLTKILQLRGFAAEINRTIHLVCNDFGSATPAVIAQVARHTPRNRRALFFLDQYGYRDVPAPLIKTIFTELPSSEVVLTFHVASFATYTNDEFTEHISQALAIDIHSALAGAPLKKSKSMMLTGDGSSRERCIRHWSTIAARNISHRSSLEVLAAAMASTGCCIYHSTTVPKM
jgi:three-Cys-motif partner protein